MNNKIVKFWISDFSGPDAEPLEDKYWPLAEYLYKVKRILEEELSDIDRALRGEIDEGYDYVELLNSGPFLMARKEITSFYGDGFKLQLEMSTQELKDILVEWKEFVEEYNRKK